MTATLAININNINMAGGGDWQGEGGKSKDKRVKRINKPRERLRAL